MKLLISGLQFHTMPPLNHYLTINIPETEGNCEIIQPAKRKAGEQTIVLCIFRIDLV